MHLFENSIIFNVSETLTCVCIKLLLQSMESASILDFEKIQNKSNAHMGSNKETPSMTFRGRVYFYC